REFADFGRLPEGPKSEVDLVDLLMDLGKSAVPPEVAVRVRANGEPCKVLGHYDPLRRAVAHPLRHASEAMNGCGAIDVAGARAGAADDRGAQRDHHGHRHAGRGRHLFHRPRRHMSPRVLLVDDETNIRKMVGALLESEGFETAEAANGSAALATVERAAPDAVLLDLMMPGGPDGLATLEQLKRLAPDVPVVMMSGKASLTDAVRATKLGAFQFVEKPLTPEGVLTTL